MTAPSPLILALDLTEEQQSLEVARATAPYLWAIKVNYPLVLNCGLGIVTELAKLRPVICDFKVADIPNTSRLIAEAVQAAGAQGLITHGFVGRNSLEQLRQSFNGDLYVVAQMSHPGAGMFFDKQALNIARLAGEIGANGLIGPATRPEWVAKLKAVSPALRLLSPGVGAQGGDPGAALKAGADKLIVGRSLYQAADPASSARQLLDSLGFSRGD